MSDNLNTPDNQSARVAQDQPLTKKKAVVVSRQSVVEVAKQRSAKDVILWIMAIVSLIVATLAGEYLPRYWVGANNKWTMLAITVGLAIFAIICVALTHQGSAFKTLLTDSGVELRRITWPSKDETTTYTWQVIVVTIIAGIFIWLLDNLFNYVVGFILN